MLCLPLKQADPRRNTNDMMSTGGPGAPGPRPPGPQNVSSGAGGDQPPNGTAATANLPPGGQPGQANLEAARRALGIDVRTLRRINNNSRSNNSRGR